MKPDGAVDQATGRAGARSVLRDTDGRWIKGSIRPLWTDSSVLAESWGLLDGLRMARIEHLIIELEVLVAINLV